MFIREKKNKSGSISIQILEKRGRKNHLIKSIGSSCNEEEVQRLKKEAEDFIRQKTGQYSLDLFQNEPSEWFNQVSESIKQVRLLGPELLLGKLYDEIGFNQVREDLLKHLVITRLVYPVSKLKTVRYLKEHQGIEYQVEQIYRYLDKLDKNHKKKVEQISYDHTLKILEGKISVVFYDVTTLYFEIDKEDELRKTGFSKEGKHQHPQILLGLLVGIEGYPLAYEVFEGNKYEGHTMLSVLEQFTNRFKIEKIVVVADSGLLTKANVKELEKKQYEYILGARLKNESQKIKDQILNCKLIEGQSKSIAKIDNQRIVITYSSKRATKDAFNRQRGLKKLEKALNKGKLNKTHINNRGYNKYLKMSGEVLISIDYEKFEQDSNWDGIKGYLTNSKLSDQEILDNYGELWKIEKAFRISKTDLKIRPIYHRLEHRIKAHICVAFIAYKLYKELERQLKVKQLDFSVERAMEILKTIFGITIQHPESKKMKTIIFAENKEQQILLKSFDVQLG